jgi:hypothetical protein
LGYEVDVQNQELKNTHTLTVQTLPRGANVSIGEEDFESNVELRTQDDISFDINIQEDNYLDEKFSFLAPPEQNSSARILNLRLLPSEISLSQEKEGFDYLSLLSQDEILLTNSEGDYFIHSYSIAGLQGQVEPIETELNREIEAGWWIQLVDKVFWNQDSGVLLYRDPVENTWKMLDLFVYPQKFISIVLFSEEEVLLLDEAGGLWVLNIETQDLDFVDAGYSGLAYTESPDSIWLWRQDRIYRLDRGRLDQSIFQVTKAPFLSDLDLLPTQPISYQSFAVKAGFLGVLFKVENDLYYSPDATSGNWHHLSNEVEFFTTHEASVFWLDQNQQLSTYNILLGSYRNFGQIDFNQTELTDIRLSYNSRWTRLFIYSQDQVKSLWVDTEIVNETISRYYPQAWIDNSLCLPEIRDSYQFCIQDNQLVQYQNNTINTF